MKSVKIADIIKLGIVSGFLGMVIFLILEVVIVDSIKTAIETYQDNFWVVIILFGGFMISAVCSAIAGSLSSDFIKERLYILWASLFALVLNLIVWIVISYVGMIDDLPEATGFERIIIFPKVISYFAIYKLSSPTQLWLLGQITFTIFFCIFLYIFTRKSSSSKRRRVKR